MEDFKIVFEEIKKSNPNMSLDELLCKTYNKVKQDGEDFETYRNKILEAENINEYEYYTKDVNKELKDYIEDNVFPGYEVNDKAHGIIHIKEVIRRSFALNDTFKLGLDKNMIYTIAACHDLGKHENHQIHEKIAANRFINDSNFEKYFSNEERQIIKDAIEDHRSSKEELPRSTYGKLISSADRNTRIEIVFIRSFFVAKERMPETNIEEYLDYTIQRLSKKYSEENPENMFYEDEIYKTFLVDMRALLKKEDEFKNRYCAVNKITSRNNKVQDEEGVING